MQTVILITTLLMTPNGTVEKIRTVYDKERNTVLTSTENSVATSTIEAVELKNLGNGFCRAGDLVIPCKQPKIQDFFTVPVEPVAPFQPPLELRQDVRE